VGHRAVLLPVGLIVAQALMVGILLTAFTGFTIGTPWLGYMFAWANYGVILFGVALVVHVLLLAKSGEARPKVAVMQRLKEMRIPALLYVLAGLVQVGFGLMKPQIAMLTGFRFDTQLAALDAAIFGQDAWRAFSWLLSLRPVLDYVYSLWYPALVGSLVLVMHRTPNAERDRAILAYFILWGVFAPIGQVLIPAAGPIFYERIGLGDRFVNLIATVPAGSAESADYLWASRGGSHFAAGISAMPSMHVAMSFWIALAFWKSRLRSIASCYFIAVFLGSILLGWHYFVDGLAGVAGGIVCWQIARGILSQRRVRALPSAPQLD
jgi:hypothetical protein